MFAGWGERTGKLALKLAKSPSSLSSPEVKDDREVRIRVPFCCSRGILPPKKGKRALLGDLVQMQNKKVGCHKNGRGVSQEVSPAKLHPTPPHLQPSDR